MRNSIVCLVLGISWSFAPSASAQYPPLGRPNFVETQLVTVGGITYFRHVSQLSAWCNRIGAYPVTRDGTNLIQAIQEEGMPPGTICVCDTVECGSPPRAERTSVLGGLAPGNYRLTILSTNNNGPLLVESTTRYFAVQTGGDLTLTASRVAGSDSVLVTVAGVANVNYVVERSTDLVVWAAVRTNSSAPFSLTVSTTEQQQFFRASISPLPLE